MKSPNTARIIMLLIIMAGLLTAGCSAVLYGAEPIHPLFILGAVLSFGGICFGIIAVRCPFCRRRLPLKGIGGKEYCPHCGERLRK